MSGNYWRPLSGVSWCRGVRAGWLTGQLLPWQMSALTLASNQLAWRRHRNQANRQTDVLNDRALNPGHESRIPDKKPPDCFVFYNHWTLFESPLGCLSGGGIFGNLLSRGLLSFCPHIVYYGPASSINFIVRFARQKVFYGLDKKWQNIAHTEI